VQNKRNEWQTHTHTHTHTIGIFLL
jgi:hypothetical protein